MVDIVDEAKEDLERERLQKIWDDYGSLIIALIIGVVVGTGAYTFYQGYTSEKNQAATTAVLNIQDAGQSGVDTTIPEALQTLDGPQNAIGSLLAVRSHLEAGNDDKALTLLKEITADQNADPIFRDFARIQTAALVLTQEGSVAADVQELLKPILDDQDNHWHAQAEFYNAIALTQADQDYRGGADILNTLSRQPETAYGIRKLSSQLFPIYDFYAEKRAQSEATKKAETKGAE